jgi:hypothetical protein
MIWKIKYFQFRKMKAYMHKKIITAKHLAVSYEPRNVAVGIEKF